MKTKAHTLPVYLLFLSSLAGNTLYASAPSINPFSSTLDGGVTVSFKTASSNLCSDLKLMPNVSSDFTGDGFALRIKNHITSGDGSPMFLYLNETDSDRVNAKANGSYTLYSTSGEVTSCTYRNGDNALILPASFDGYIYVPYDGLEIKSGYGTGDKVMDYSSVYAVYLEVNTYYDAFSNFSLGGIEVLKDNAARKVLDPTLLNDLTYSNYYCKDYNGEYIILDHKSVGTGDVSTSIDYSKVALSENLNGGLQVSYNGAESDIIAQWGICPSLRDYGTDTDSLAIRIKNQTSISTPITIALKNRRGISFAVNKETGLNVCFKEKGGVLSINSWRSWDSAVVIPSGFDGWMILPLDIFMTGTVADPSDVKQITFSTSVYKSYDAFTSLTVGDVQLIKDDESVDTLIDASSLSDDDFASTYVKIANEDYIKFERYTESKLVAERKGDVKYLERINHVSNDTELNSEFPVWSGGSKLTTTLVDTYDEHKGIRVDIGEVIANNNIYGSFDVFPKYYTEDWTNWADGGEEKNQEAKGITCYLKNLSRKEITINVEFEERTKVNGESVAERWNVQLGSMLMYYDINTKQEFIRMAKPSIVIPVGFEGYIRIDFSQYSVPSWCTVGDMQLDLNATMSGIFVTTDCSNNEGLSFVISDFGVYFNETKINTLFETSDKSIQANMED